MAPQPLHPLVLMVLYFKRPHLFDPLALVLSATTMDIEVIYAYAVGLPTPHLVLHSFVVALTIYPVAISLLAYALERKMGGHLGKIYKAIKWKQKVIYPFMTILACSLMGSLSHMLIDVWSHPVSPFLFWPFAYLPSNPLYIGEWSIVIDAAVAIISLYAVYLWAEQWKLLSKPRE